MYVCSYHISRESQRPTTSSTSAPKPTRNTQFLSLFPSSPPPTQHCYSTFTYLSHLLLGLSRLFHHYHYFYSRNPFLSKLRLVFTSSSSADFLTPFPFFFLVNFSLHFSQKNFPPNPHSK